MPLLYILIRMCAFCCAKTRFAPEKDGRGFVRYGFAIASWSGTTARLLAAVYCLCFTTPPTTHPSFRRSSCLWISVYLAKTGGLIKHVRVFGMWAGMVGGCAFDVLLSVLIFEKLAMQGNLEEHSLLCVVSGRA